VDAWAAGCVVAELLTGWAPFRGVNSDIDQMACIADVLGSPNEARWPGFSALPGATQLLFRDREGCGVRAALPQSSPLAVDFVARLLR